MSLIHWGYSLPGADFNDLPDDLGEVYDLKSKIPRDSGLYPLISLRESLLERVVSSFVKNVFLSLLIIPIETPDDFSFSVPLDPSLGNPGDLLHYKIVNITLKIPYKFFCEDLKPVIKRQKAFFLNRQVGTHALGLIHILAIQGRINSLNALCSSIRKTFNENPKCSTRDAYGLLKCENPFTVIDLNLQDNRGFSAEHHAALHNNIDFLRLLARNGAQIGGIYNFRSAEARHLMSLCYPNTAKWSLYHDGTYNLPILVHPSEIVKDWNLGKRNLRCLNPALKWYHTYLKELEVNKSAPLSIFKLPDCMQLFESIDSDYACMGTRVQLSKNVLKGQIIGYYGGLVFNKSSPVHLDNELYILAMSNQTEEKDPKHSETNIDGRNGPFISRIEDGFPNILDYRDFNCFGLQAMSAFFSGEDLPSGTTLRFNYGSLHPVKKHHIESHFDEIEKFVRELDIDAFLSNAVRRELNDPKLWREKLLSLIDFELTEARIIYLFETPSTLIQILAKVSFTKDIFAKWLRAFERRKNYYPPVLLQIISNLKNLYNTRDDTELLRVVFEKVVFLEKANRAHAAEEGTRIDCIKYIASLLNIIKFISLDDFLSAEIE